MKVLSSIFGVVFLLLPIVSYAQFIKGKVTDVQGEALIGVYVNVKHTNTNAITDFDGNYQIKATDKDILAFSYIGFSPQDIPVKGQTTINIVMKEDSQNLDEVVVTAIGIKQQKKKLGYTTQQINSEALSEAQTMNVGSALSGQISGLAVNNPTGIFQAPSFSLRGKNPLIVLDGIPIETDFFDIGSENIESINVLKGPTASALYGSRGKNGAILITSKTAKKEGLEVTISTNNMITAGFTVFPESQTSYGSGSNGKYEFWDGADGGISDGDMTWGPKLNTGSKVAQWNSPIRNKQTGEVIPWYGNVSGTVYDDKSLYERVPIDWVSHDNLKDFLGTGIVTNNNFAISYKGAKARYYVSGKYAYQKGQVPNTSLHSTGLNFNSSFDLTNSIQLDASLAYNKVYSPNYPRYGYGPKNHMYTILLWMGNDVNGKDLRDHRWVPGLEGYRQASYNYAWYNNPYFAAEELQQKKDQDIIDGKLRLNWQILPNLSVQGRLAMHQIGSYEDLQTPKSYMNYGDSRAGDFKTLNSTKQNIDADVLVSYFQPLTNKINLTANVGASLFRQNYREQFQSTDGLTVPGLYNMSNSQGPTNATNKIRNKEIHSIYGSANVDFYDAVFLNFTARNDWSSTLPTSNNSYFYPSISLSTLINEYVKLPKSINFLKLYGSWAQVSSDLDPYSLYATYDKGVIYGSNASVTYPNSLFNPNIKPEKSTSYEFGLSTAFLKNRINLDVTYYHIKDENQIINLNVSEASGFTSRKVNGNVYNTNGLEIIIGAKPIISKDFSWDVALNWSRYVRKLSEIYGGQNKYNNLSKGDRADALYGTVWQTSANGELIIDPNSGLPIKDPYQKKLGHTDPSWRLGLQNKFKIKNFRVEVDIDGSWGGLIRSVTTEKM